MRRIIRARIKELQAARDAFVAEANANIRAYEAAIGELEKLLAKKAAPQLEESQHDNNQ